MKKTLFAIHSTLKRGEGGQTSIFSTGVQHFCKRLSESGNFQKLFEKHCITSSQLRIGPNILKANMFPLG